VTSFDEGGGNRAQATMPVVFWRVAVPLMIGIGVIVALAAIVFQEPLPGIALLIVVLWNGYWWCWRLAFELTITNRSLHWRGALRTGSVPLADVVAIEPALMHLLVSIRSRQGRLVVYPSMTGLLETINRMQQLSPNIALNLPLTWLRRWEARGW